MDCLITYVAAVRTSAGSLPLQEANTPVYKLIKGLSGPDAGKGQHKSVLQIARAVFWSFFGVRKMRDLDKDAVSITPLQVIGAGLIGAVILVICLILFVHWVVA
jgi:hypothetical protein